VSKTVSWRQIVFEIGAVASVVTASFAAPHVLPKVMPEALVVEPRLVFGLLLCCALVMAVATAALMRGLPRGERALGLFAAVLVGSCAFAALTMSDHLIFQATLPYCFLVLVTGVTMVLRPDGAELRRMVVVMALLVSLGVLADAEGLYGRLLWQSAWARSKRPGGFLAHRNNAGEYLAIALPICLGALDRGVRRLALPLVGLALAVTRCRTAWLAAGLGTVLVVALVDRALRRSRLLAAALVLLGMVAASVVPLQLRWVEERPYVSTMAHVVDLGSGSGAVRVKHYRETFAVLRGHWWRGLGPGSWSRLVVARDPSLVGNFVPNSDYLRYLCDGGLPALAAFLGLGVTVAVLAWRSRRGAGGEPLAVVTSLGVICLADTPLYRLEVIALVVPIVMWVARERRVAAPAAEQSSAPAAPPAPVTASPDSSPS
jgi:hypothetical protein